MTALLDRLRNAGPLLSALLLLVASALVSEVAVAAEIDAASAELGAEIGDGESASEDEERHDGPDPIGPARAGSLHSATLCARAATAAPCSVPSERSSAPPPARGPPLR